jgi:hypothetical protein
MLKTGSTRPYPSASLHLSIHDLAYLVSTGAVKPSSSATTRASEPIRRPQCSYSSSIFSSLTLQRAVRGRDGLGAVISRSSRSILFLTRVHTATKLQLLMRCDSGGWCATSFVARGRRHTSPVVCPSPHLCIAVSPAIATHLWIVTSAIASVIRAARLLVRSTPPPKSKSGECTCPEGAVRGCTTASRWRHVHPAAVILNADSTHYPRR